MTSLATAFLAAGADAVVATCWPIRDDSASLITTVFHRALRGGMAPDAALRRARIEAIRTHPGKLGWVPYQLLVASRRMIEERI
jgi:CHAT domain-containing protein